MAVLPGNTEIQYADVEPRAQTGLARVTPVNTGSEAFARGVEKLGGAFQEVAEAQIVTDFNTKKRQYDKAMFDAHQQYIQEGDKDKRDKIREDAFAQAHKIFDTDNVFARKRYNEHRDELLARDGETFSTTEFNINKRNQHDAYLANYQHAAEMGNVNGGENNPGMVFLTHQQVATNQMSPAEGDERNKDAPYKSAITQANKAIYDNPEAAQEFLKVENFQGADTEMLKQRAEMQSLAVEQLNHLGVQFDNNINELMNKIDQQPNLPEVQLRDSAADLDRQIDASNIGGKRKMQLHKEVRSWVKDEGNMDFERIRSLEDRVERVKAYGVNDSELVPDINRARLEGALGSRKEGSGKEANRLIKSATSAKINVSIAATRGIQEQFAKSAKDPQLEHLLHKDILGALDEHPEWNDTQAMSFAASRAKVYENIKEQQSGTLIEMRERGQKYLGWQELPQEAQKKDLESIRNLKVPTFMMGKTSLSGDWTKADVQKAQEIIGDSKEITPDMTKQFSDYLTEQGKAHFEQVGLKRVTTKEQRDALPSGTKYIGKDGLTYTKK